MSAMSLVVTICAARGIVLYWTALFRISPRIDWFTICVPRAGVELEFVPFEMDDAVARRLITPKNHSDVWSRSDLTVRCTTFSRLRLVWSNTWRMVGQKGGTHQLLIYLHSLLHWMRSQQASLRGFITDSWIYRRSFEDSV